MWIKLLGTESMSTLMRPQLINGKWRKPVIQARQKKQLRGYFEKAGVPWIYDADKPEIHSASAYNRKPKGTTFRNNYETRLAMIRKNLSTMDDRIDKARIERLQNKPPTEDEQHMLGVYKALASEAAAGKFKQQTASKARAAAKAENSSIGIETRKSSPVKKQSGSSRGGALSKKERETSSMAGDMVTGREPEQ